MQLIFLHICILVAFNATGLIHVTKYRFTMVQSHGPTSSLVSPTLATTYQTAFSFNTLVTTPTSHMETRSPTTAVDTELLALERVDIRTDMWCVRLRGTVGTQTTSPEGDLLARVWSLPAPVPHPLCGSQDNSGWIRLRHVFVMRNIDWCVCF